MMDWLLRPDPPATVTIGEHELPVAIRRHPRATRLTMRLAPDGSEIRVTLPRWGRTADALVFAHKRIDWLADQLRRLPQAAPAAPGGSMTYRGEPIAIAWNPAHPRKPALAGNRLELGGPQDSAPARIRRWLEDEALRLLEADLAFYCQRAGLAAPRLRLSRAIRRWGSCSSPRKGESCIRINWRLIQAPDQVRRSVVAHEVAHLVHFDHSPAFHALLAGLYDGDLKAADAWLKHEGRTLYACFG